MAEFDNVSDEARTLAADALRRVAADAGTYADGLIASLSSAPAESPGAAGDILARLRAVNDRLEKKIAAKKDAEALAQHILLTALRIALHAATAAL